MTPEKFVEAWAGITLNERASAQPHFEAVCRMVGHELPHEKDPKGEFFAYEYGVQKSTGGQGFADVFYKGHFAIEYKGIGKYKDLNDAYQQLLRYRENLFNPPLLIVCDIAHWEVHTNFPNTEKKVYRFTNADIPKPQIQRLLHNLFYNPDALHPDRNTAQVTADAAKVFERIAENMRGWKSEPDRIAHFLTKLVFCLFAEDVTLLPAMPNTPKGIFSTIVEQTRTNPPQFKRYLGELFSAMADGGNVLMQTIPYFNGKLFEDVDVEELSLEALTELAKASQLDWSAIEPAIFGTLFERSLDPSKRAQLGAHYTSRDDILLIVEPVLMQPLRREWDALKADAAKLREEYDKAETPRVKLNRQNELLALREKMLARLRTVKVLDPACGSGNFLYVALNLLLDMEKAVMNDPLFAGMPLALPEVHPRQLYGIELEPIAHALASIVVWIGYIQWRQNNGYMAFKEPILEQIGDNIRRMDAIVQFVPTPQPPPQKIREGESGRDSLQISSPQFMEGELGSDALNIPSPQLREGESGVGTLHTHSPAQTKTVNSTAATGLPSPSLGEGLGVGTQHIPVWTTRDLYEKLKPLARQMRNAPTPAEDALWQRIRKRQIGDAKFRRQHHIDRFIVDFYSPELRLIIEVDGDIHDYTQEEDAIRQAFLENLGMRVLRFKNHEVFQNIKGVLEVIGEAVEEQRNVPTPQIPPSEAKITEGESRSERLQVSSPPQSNTVEKSLIAGTGLPSPSLGEGPGVGTKLIPIEPEWPEVDVIIGNPPFLGGHKLRGELGSDYVNHLFKLYDGRVPPSADLVCYWFERARRHLEENKVKRVGLLSTNSIRGGANREVLKHIKETGDIFMAWADREWVLEGAAVRVSMIGFDDKSENQRILNGKPVSSINPDLSASVDVTTAKRLPENKNICMRGDEKHGAFDIPHELAIKMMGGVNKSYLPNTNVIRRYVNALDVLRTPRNMWVIDFVDMPLSEAEKYEMPIAHIRQFVKPERDKNNRNSRRERWWQHGEIIPNMRKAIASLPRFIATPSVAKHRIFVWLESNVVPDHQLQVITRDDDYFFGLLHSKIHEVWALRMGTSLEDRPRYTPTTTFETFPFPYSPGKEDTRSAAYQAVSAAAKCLHEERAAWLNPEGMSEKSFKDRTLTDLYNALNVFRGKEKIKTKPAAGDFAPRLDALHDALDRAVCDAYGWPHSILEDEEEILRRLLALNLERAGG